MHFVKSIATLVMASGILGIMQTASAEESGSFELISHFSHNHTTLEHAGQTVTGGAMQGTSTIFESDGGPFVEDTNSFTVCIVYSKKSDVGQVLEAPCAFTDDSGDKWFSLSKRAMGDIATVGSGGEGRQEILGGTGKYEGVTGSCTYTIAYRANNKAVVRRNCMWHSP